MDSHTENVAAARFRLALDLFEAGLEMMRTRLEREHPDLDPGGIEDLLVEWLRTRPGAPHGDAKGRLRHPPGTTP